MISKTIIISIAKILTFLALIIGSILKIKSYINDTNQKKLQNTKDYIKSFQSGTEWFQNSDRKNWNGFLKLIINKDDSKMLNDKIIYSDSEYTFGEGEQSTEKHEKSISELFNQAKPLEGIESINLILKSLDFIAQQALKDKLDNKLIEMSLADYYIVANHYKTCLGESRSNICKLYQKLKLNKKNLQSGFFIINN